jgi:hypothetical protein
VVAYVANLHEISTGIRITQLALIFVQERNNTRLQQHERPERGS